MGALDPVLITGASGFIGRAAVAETRRRSVPVIAVVRRDTALWQGDDGVTVLTADLSDPAAIAPLRAAIERCSAVIHAAAHLGGNAGSIAADTGTGTETILTALGDSASRFVLVSSIAVYDTMRLAPGDRLDESALLATVETASDAYAAGKIRQETLIRDAGRKAWVLRPGAVYGPGRSWHALLGFWVSKLFVQIDGGGELPLVHVDHLAFALVQAAQTDPEGIVAVNVLDDDRPTRRRYVRAHRAATGWPKVVLPLRYALWRALIAPLCPFSRNLPGLFREPVLRARLMPLRYPNTRLRAALGGQDTAPFEVMLARSVEARA